MTVYTQNINQASFLTAFGCKLKEIKDKYPANTFVVEAPQWLLWYQKHIGWVSYRKFCNQRVRLKERGRTQAGLPKHFTGQAEGFTFKDLVKITPLRPASPQGV
jgi:hypothetical protein